MGISGPVNSPGLITFAPRPTTGRALDNRKMGTMRRTALATGQSLALVTGQSSALVIDQSFALVTGQNSALVIGPCLTEDPL